MGFFIDRSEQDGETKIILSKAAVFYYATWGMIIFGLLSWHYDDLFTIPALLSALVMFVFAVPYWPVNFEIRKAMRKGQVIVSGSKYSFRNPLTYVVKREQK